MQCLVVHGVLIVCCCESFCYDDAINGLDEAVDDANTKNEMAHLAKEKENIEAEMLAQFFVSYTHTRAARESIFREASFRKGSSKNDPCEP
jgi:hypothetical protein